METDDLARTLREAGAEVILAHAVEIADPLDGGLALKEAVARLESGSYSWVAFTSANAVDRVVACLEAPGHLGSALLAAVGRQTASALARHGIRADLVGEQQSARGLVTAFARAGSTTCTQGPGATVLYPCAAGARRVLTDGLGAKGWSVERVVAYRSVPAPSPAEPILAQVTGATAIVFASPSAVRAFVAWRTGTPPAPLRLPPVVACIGPVTARAARDVSVEVAVVAPAPSPEALANAIGGALEALRAGVVLE